MTLQETRDNSVEKNPLKIHFEWLVRVVAVWVCAATCFAQYRILPGNADSDGCNPTAQARICLGATGEERCYAPPNDIHPSDKGEYIFGLEPKAKAIGRVGGQELTLFTAMFSGCGSGTLTHFSLLTVRDGEFVNLLPKVELTNQSEYRVWSFPHLSALPILVTADFAWDFDAGETHFAHHRYEISAYSFDPRTGRYQLKTSYQTTRKYAGLDDSDAIHVLEAERPTLLAKLRMGPR